MMHIQHLAKLIGWTPLKGRLCTFRVAQTRGLLVSVLVGEKKNITPNPLE